MYVCVCVCVGGGGYQQIPAMEGSFLYVEGYAWFPTISSNFLKKKLFSENDGFMFSKLSKITIFRFFH